jgi:endonuclease G
MPVFTAVNIDGMRFRKLLRKSLFPSGSDQWRVDARAADFQWGEELYKVPGSDYDKGHLVKREDPQWGDDDEEAAEGSLSTFFFTNCAPQVADLNRREWRYLEDYILKKESATHKQRVTVMTGPVLADDDLVLATPVNGQTVKLPGYFWKVVYFTNDNKTLRRVGFLMGQKELLLTKGIGRPAAGTRGPVSLRLFEDYEDAATYQVNLPLIESLTGLVFSPAEDAYQDERASKIVLKEVEITATRGMKAAEEASDGALPANFELEGLVL